MNGMSEREYSTHSGLSRGAVQNAKRGGRLVFYADGSINAAASDVRRTEMTDPDQQRRSLGGDAALPTGSSGGTDSYLKARTVLTVYQALNANWRSRRRRACWSTGRGPRHWSSAWHGKNAMSG